MLIFSNIAYSQTYNFTCNTCNHTQLLSKWVSSFPDDVMLPVIVLFKGQPSIDDLKLHKQIDYTTEIELIKSNGGNVTRTFNIINAIAANIPKDRVLSLSNDTMVSNIDPDIIGHTANPKSSISVEIESKLALSPMKQTKLGIITKDIQCNDGLTLLVKLEDHSPACVTSETATRLVERGWGQLL